MTGGDFNPTNQLIDVNGAHEFIAAAPSDLRGPCPGLNALANHGYIPRNGIVPVLEAILTSVDGMSHQAQPGVLG
jgi:hypothetical protein